MLTDHPVPHKPAALWAELRRLDISPFHSHLGTALHEAGHALRATRSGAPVESASIKPDEETLGRVSFNFPGPDTDDDCRPSGKWWSSRVAIMLAGDRAERLLDPFLDTSGGAPCSDYAKAVRLIEAVHRDDRLTQSVLGVVSDVLDSWLGSPAVVRDLVAIAAALLREGSLTGDEIRALVAASGCGAAHPTMADVACTKGPHLRGWHGYVMPHEVPAQWVRWDGWPAPPTKKAATATLRAVQQALDPPSRLPRKRGIGQEAFHALAETAGQTALSDVQRRQLSRYLRDRASSPGGLLLPIPAQGLEDLNVEDLHELTCSRPELGRASDGALWCPSCALELEAPQGRSRHVYVMVEIGGWDERDREVSTNRRYLGHVFRTAEQAATFVRESRAYGTRGAHLLHVVREALK